MLLGSSRPYPLILEKMDVNSLADDDDGGDDDDDDDVMRHTSSPFPMHLNPFFRNEVCMAQTTAASLQLMFAFSKLNNNSKDIF